MNTRDYVGLGVLAGLGYVVYRTFIAPDAAAKKAVDSVAGVIAKPFIALDRWWYGTFDMVPTGNVILPNGTKVPMSKLHVTWDQDVGVASFVYNGFGYIIRPNPDGGAGYDQNGDYHAE
jgi:hypothetical protein